MTLDRGIFPNLTIHSVDHVPRGTYVTYLESRDLDSRLIEPLNDSMRVQSFSLIQSLSAMKEFENQ